VPPGETPTSEENVPVNPFAEFSTVLNLIIATQRVRAKSRRQAAYPDGVPNFRTEEAGFLLKTACYSG